MSIAEATTGTEDRGAGINSIDRALVLLTVMGEASTPLSLARLADRMGLHRSTVLRTLTTLEARRFALRMADGRWALGPALLRLGAACRASISLRAVGEPHLLALAATTGESATLFVREGGQRLCLLRVESQQDVRDHMAEGSLLPLDRGAAGRVLQEAPEALPYAGPGLVISLGGTNPELAAVAAPVLGAGGRLLAAVSCGGTCSRFIRPDHQARIAAAVRQDARALSLTLGCDPAIFDALD